MYSTLMLLNRNGILDLNFQNLQCLANILHFHFIKLMQDVQWIYWYNGDVSRLSIDQQPLKVANALHIK